MSLLHLLLLLRFFSGFWIHIDVEKVMIKRGKWTYTETEKGCGVWENKSLLLAAFLYLFLSFSWKERNRLLLLLLLLLVFSSIQNHALFSSSIGIVLIMRIITKIEFITRTIIATTQWSHYVNNKYENHNATQYNEPCAPPWWSRWCHIKSSVEFQQ